MFDSQVILWGEIWCWSQLEVKKLNVYHLFLVLTFIDTFLRLWNTCNMSLWAMISWLIKALSGGHYYRYSAVRSFQLYEERTTWKIDNVYKSVKRSINSLGDSHMHSKTENSVNRLRVKQKINSNHKQTLWQSCTKILCYKMHSEFSMNFLWERKNSAP